MKALLTLLLVLIVFQGMSQKKKKSDAKDAQIDTLTQNNALLTKQVDSISKDRALYYGLYTVIKEKVLMNDFDPARFDKIVDSIRTTRDSAHATALAPMGSLKDSLTMMATENKHLKQRLDSMSHTAAAAADKTKLVGELKDLKSLLDNKIITQAEFDEKKKIIMSKWQ
jgi:hypothetical protein